MTVLINKVETELNPPLLRKWTKRKSHVRKLQRTTPLNNITSADSTNSTVSQFETSTEAQANKDVPATRRKEAKRAA
jgi:hypothetical protein